MQSALAGAFEPSPPPYLDVLVGLTLRFALSLGGQSFSYHGRAVLNAAHNHACAALQWPAARVQWLCTKYSIGQVIEGRVDIEVVNEDFADIKILAARESISCSPRESPSSGTGVLPFFIRLMDGVPVRAFHSATSA